LSMTTPFRALAMAAAPRKGSSLTLRSRSVRSAKTRMAGGCAHTNAVEYKKQKKPPYRDAERILRTKISHIKISGGKCKAGCAQRCISGCILPRPGSRVQRSTSTSVLLCLLTLSSSLSLLAIALTP
jgi:hypothetical protein